MQLDQLEGGVNCINSKLSNSVLSFSSTTCLLIGFSEQVGMTSQGKGAPALVTGYVVPLPEVDEMLETEPDDE